MSHTRNLVAVTLWAVFTACGDDVQPPAGRPLPPVAWEGRNLRVASDLPYALCGGTAVYMDDVLGSLRERWGTPVQEPSLYYALEHDLSEYDTPCLDGQEGCVAGGVAYTGLAPFDHELVHLAREPMGFSFSLIEEGAAEYWGDDAPLRPELGGEILELVEAERYFDLRQYARAGHFVAYLVDQHGEQALDSLSRATELESSADDFRDAVAEIYGLSLEQLVQDYEAGYPECSQSEYRNAFGECLATAPRPLCTADAGLVLQRQVSCEDQDVLGPRLDRVWTTIAVEVETAGSYDLMFTAVSVEGVELTMRGCGGGCPAATFGPVSPFEGWFSADLAVGVHVIKIEWPAGSQLDFELRFRGCSA